jgi:hypothetical protein
LCKGANGQTSTTITGLGAGKCKVIVIDENSCSAHAAILVAKPAYIDLVINEMINTSVGGYTGGIDISMVDATAPYSYYGLLQMVLPFVRKKI